MRNEYVTICFNRKRSCLLRRISALKFYTVFVMAIHSVPLLVLETQKYTVKLQFIFWQEIYGLNFDKYRVIASHLIGCIDFLPIFASPLFSVWIQIRSREWTFGPWCQPSGCSDYYLGQCRPRSRDFVPRQAKRMQKCKNLVCWYRRKE